MGANQRGRKAMRPNKRPSAVTGDQTTHTPTKKRHTSRPEKAKKGGAREIEGTSKKKRGRSVLERINLGVRKG